MAARANSIDRQSISRGESLGFMFEVEKVPADAICTIHVRQRRGGDDQITARVVEADAQSRYIGTLTPEETDLAPGQYFLIADMQGTDFAAELWQRFVVREAFVSGGEA